MSKIEIRIEVKNSHEALHVELPCRLNIGDVICPYRFITDEQMESWGLTWQVVQERLQRSGTVVKVYFDSEGITATLDKLEK